MIQVDWMDFLFHAHLTSQNAFVLLRWLITIRTLGIIYRHYDTIVICTLGFGVAAATSTINEEHVLNQSWISLMLTAVLYGRTGGRADLTGLTTKT